jgi:hypothetical protein
MRTNLEEISKMTKQLFTLFAVGAMALACAPKMHAAIEEELVLNDGVGDIATIDVSDANVVTCTGACGGLGIIHSGGKDGTIVAVGTLGQFTIDATAKGGGTSTLPTLQNLNQIQATSSGAGVLTSTFTDTNYSDVNGTLVVADSNVNDQQIAGSTIQFTVSTDAPTAVPAGTQIFQNTLTGASDSNGAIGMAVANPNSPDASITANTVMTFLGTGSIQANITVANVLVPEPASVMLLGTVFLGLAGLIRKAQSKRA